MWEKFKTVFLCLLIASSLLLTYRLWYGSPDYEAMTPPQYERISFGEAPPLEEFLVPEKVVYLEPVLEEPELTEYSPQEEGEEGDLPEEETSREEASAEGEEDISPEEAPREEEVREEDISPGITGFDAHLLKPGNSFFNSLWEELSREIKEATLQTLRFRREDGEKLPDLQEVEEPSLVFYFNLPFSPQVFFPSQESMPSTPPFRKLYLFLQEEGPRGFVETPQGDFYRVEWDLNPNHFLALGEEIKSGKDPDGKFLEEIISRDPALEENFKGPNVFVPLESPGVPDLNCQQEEMDVDQLARAFFVDFSVVRQIKQRDEGVFYTDGRKGLRIDSQGSIEYSAPAGEQEGEAFTPGEAFRRGLEYVTVYGGWPQELDLRVAEFGKVNLEQEEFYRLDLSGYYRGIPLTREFMTLELIYDEQGLVSFHRHLCQLEPSGGEGEVIGIEKALQGMLEGFPELFTRESPRRVSDLYLAYNPGPENMEASLPVEPCWVVELDGRQQVYLNARTGEPQGEVILLD
ncbi:MAG: hypothetical protein D5R97_03785 [Candidatus Syntrophonatronum acetioxidans]|uniref:Regulatory protein YycH domain-containing protein n=1 Tax=Candidatus Syntrophonatronum acetioxidans TaxID=1795816 RepID=A0A424YFS7_9FIRM|nr:MAG: hypothetical protein D5R97_03785 [Candidatus Syntrophonatronum acetioxidans]